MKIHKIEAGTFQIDGGAVFGVVPKRVWEKRYPCNDNNFCRLAMRCLLVDTGEKRILFDSGTGDKHLEYLKYYHFENIINFETVLNKLGYSCTDITDVVLTHLHFDHCGGCTYYNTDCSTPALTFPNATHWVGKAQWENSLHPNLRENDSYFPENMLPIQEAGKLAFINKNQWLCPEVELRLFNGHTAGQLVGYIHSNKQTLVYVGDVIPIAATIPVSWISAFDTYPITAMEEKQLLLTEAIEKQQLLFFGHDAYTECCTVKEVNGKFNMGEKKGFCDELGE
jgi:glyoxylase-like metal-dependent hydrolase (beta-lactamase superfamily II)